MQAPLPNKKEMADMFGITLSLALQPALFHLDFDNL